jgi:hypothetical protein
MPSNTMSSDTSLSDDSAAPYRSLEDARSDGYLTVAEARRRVQAMTPHGRVADGKKEPSGADVEENCGEYGHLRTVEIGEVRLLGVTIPPPYRFELWAYGPGEADGEEWPKTFVHSAGVVFDPEADLPGDLVERTRTHSMTQRAGVELSMFEKDELEASVREALDVLGVPNEHRPGRSMPRR